MPKQAGIAMIQCSICKEWFHVGVCVDVPTQALDSATKWFCNKCNQKLSLYSFVVIILVHNFAALYIAVVKRCVNYLTVN